LFDFFSYIVTYVLNISEVGISIVNGIEVLKCLPALNPLAPDSYWYGHKLTVNMPIKVLKSKQIKLLWEGTSVSLQKLSSAKSQKYHTKSY